MTQAIVNAAVRDPSPEDSEQLCCPLCDYNLRGLTEPRCPECGYRSTWEELTDPTRRLHPYLYEHHPESGFRSFFRTMNGGWQARKFWRSLHPLQPARPKRLFKYWMLNALLALFILLFTVGPCWMFYIARNNAASRVSERRWLAIDKTYLVQITKRFGTVEAYLDQSYPVSATGVARQFAQTLPENANLIFPTLLIAWPLFIFLGLWVFQHTLRRRRLRSIHIWRCVIYSSDFVCLLALLPFLRSLQLGMIPSPPSLIGSLTVVSIGLIALPLLSAYRVHRAVKHYLRFDRPLATSTAAHLIAALLALNVLWAPLLWM